MSFTDPTCEAFTVISDMALETATPLPASELATERLPQISSELQEQDRTSIAAVAGSAALSMLKFTGSTIKNTGKVYLRIGESLPLKGQVVYALGTVTVGGYYLHEFLEWL